MLRRRRKCLKRRGDTPRPPRAYRNGYATRGCAKTGVTCKSASEEDLTPEVRSASADLQREVCGSGSVAHWSVS
jgi:hypothetical protein